MCSEKKRAFNWVAETKSLKAVKYFSDVFSVGRIKISYNLGTQNLKNDFKVI